MTFNRFYFRFISYIRSSNREVLMDRSLFGTMIKLGCRHPMDMFHDPMLRAKVYSVDTYYRGMRVKAVSVDGGANYRFIYASVATGFVYRKLTVDTVTEFTIREVDHNRLLGIPYKINYEVPVAPDEPNTNSKRHNPNAGVEDASHLIVLSLAFAVTASVLYKRFMSDSSNPTKGKK